MINKYFTERLPKLRSAKKVSAREMSLAIGMNANYINKLENGKSLPSMIHFSYICEYLGITPEEFFANDNNDPIALKELISEVKGLDSRQVDVILHLVREIKNKN